MAMIKNVIAQLNMVILLTFLFKGAAFPARQAHQVECA
jgi:hypothetical protein